MDWYTVIPTKDRPTELDNLLLSLQGNQVGDPRRILVINNGQSWGVSRWARENATIMQDSNQDPHIYNMWNWGLVWAERQATFNDVLVSGDNPWWASRHADKMKPHAVAVLNDDVQLPPNFAARMIETLRDTDCTIAFPDQGPGIVNRIPTERLPGTRTGEVMGAAQKRITGYAFVVNGTHGIRCDENFKWHYGDDDLDWQARRDYNGTCEVSGVTVKHLHPGKSTNASPALTEQAGRDREAFIKKWGKPPW